MKKENMAVDGLRKAEMLEKANNLVQSSVGTHFIPNKTQVLGYEIKDLLQGTIIDNYQNEIAAKNKIKELNKMAGTTRYRLFAVEVKK